MNLIEQTGGYISAPSIAIKRSEEKTCLSMIHELANPFPFLVSSVRKFSSEKTSDITDGSTTTSTKSSAGAASAQLKDSP